MHVTQVGLPQLLTEEELSWLQACSWEVLTSWPAPESRGIYWFCLPWSLVPGQVLAIFHHLSSLWRSCLPMKAFFDPGIGLPTRLALPSLHPQASRDCTPVTQTTTTTGRIRQMGWLAAAPALRLPGPYQVQGQQPTVMHCLPPQQPKHLEIIG